jgi:hypothetical protein
VLLLLACDDATSVAPANIEAVVSEAIPTVVTVCWTTAEPTTGTVEFGDDLSQSTPREAAPTEDHEALLLGLAQGSEVPYRIVVDAEDGPVTSDTLTVTTGYFPPDVPALTVTGDGQDRYMLTPVLGSTTGATIIRPDGETTWFWPDARGLDVYRVRLSLDGQSILYNAASVSGDPAEDSELMRVSLDGSQVTSLPVPLLAHDFVELPDGTLGAIAVEYREFEGEELRGDRIVEVHADGTVVDVWSAWDCFDPAQVTGDAPDQGWTFANALDYDPAQDAWYLGLRNFSSIVKIGRGTWAL